jgi:hypothetical protein
VPALSGRAVRSGTKSERGAPSAPDRQRVVRPDGSTPVAAYSRAGPESRSTHPPRHAGLEVAQRVWHRSLELAGTGRHRHLSDQALALARTAGNDPDTMTHALCLGRSRARHPSNDETTRRGVRLLERAIAYLGVRVELGDIASTEARRAAVNPRAGLRAGSFARANITRQTTGAEGRPRRLNDNRGSWPDHGQLTRSHPQPAPPPEPVPPPEPMRPHILRSAGRRGSSPGSPSAEPTRGGHHVEFN